MTGHDGVLARQGLLRTRPTASSATSTPCSAPTPSIPTLTADTTAANGAERDWLGGMNWRIAGPSAVLQVNYLRKTFLDIQPSRHVVMANVQTAW
jgi:hypothetical protein